MLAARGERARDGRVRRELERREEARGVGVLGHRQRRRDDDARPVEEDPVAERPLAARGDELEAGATLMRGPLDEGDGLDRGESVVVTCMGGLGRSGMIAACTLVDAGVASAAAIASVRAARGPRAIETSGQEAFVSAFADSRALRTRSRPTSTP